MMKKNIMLLLVAIALASGGCAPTPMYYWGNYSTTLYHFRKDASDEAQDKHMAELESIIEQSKEHNQRIPPGVYCELGYMYATKGNQSKGMELFILEKTTYPESTKFVDRLVEKMKTVDKVDKKTAGIEMKKI